MLNNSFRPDVLFEVSWEVCNKVGGIYTVLATKSDLLYNELGDSHIYIGPDVWMETTNTPDFKEDKSIYQDWVEVAHSKGLSFRIGRWTVPGSPVVILVDFKQYFSERNKIFAEYWEKYGLDSISGQWDYIEPAMFGYAAAKVIENYYDFYVSYNDVIQAQFHEWMSGMGVIYIKDKLPQIGTIFTTHATILGRVIAGNGLELYKNMKSYVPREIAQRYGVMAKYSMEYLSVKLCDVFTTVSELTSYEAKVFYNRAADVVMPNGFVKNDEVDFNYCETVREKSRGVILNVVEAMLSVKFNADTKLIMTSGRYEFRNKGLDIFIESLAKLNDCGLNHDVIAMICVPANVMGPQKKLQEKLNGNDVADVNKFLTHAIYNVDYDPVINACKQFGLNNDENSKVKVIFVPTYLDGKDGIFNISYYEMLAAADLSVFASYYEPYGYTPLESISYAVPTITTSLSGFGHYVSRLSKDISQGVMVLERNDSNYVDAMNKLAEVMCNYLNISDEQRQDIRRQTLSLSENFLWDKLIDRYIAAYEHASFISQQREEQYKDKQRDMLQITHSLEATSVPKWRKLFVKQELPDSLKPLKELSMNLWWSWNKKAEHLFESIDEKAWKEHEHNPISMLEALSVEQISDLDKNADFLQKLGEVYAEFKQYMDESENKSKPSVAYFSMEYGIHNTLKIFSGGLGMLAGDYLKEMSDSNVDAVGIGLLYRHGYFAQSLTPSGEQIATYTPQKFTHLPVSPVRNENGELLVVKIALPARNMDAKVWRVDVGRIHLYLLDTDVETNRDIDRTVTYQLYGGDIENRLKQEILLGIGGMRLLRLLNLSPTLYHLNEGHAAFVGIERVRELVEKQSFMFDEALQIVRMSTLFTTHTPVPAGHDEFSEDLIRTYLPNYPNRMNCSWDTMMNLGKYHHNSNEKFSMSVLAINTAQEVNGVSKIHGDVTKDMFLDMYRGYYKNELYIDYVTNGVHYPTWVAEDWEQLHLKYFGKEFLKDQMNPKYWSKIYDVPNEEIWAIRNKLRKVLVDELKVRLRVEMTRRQDSPKTILKAVESLNENTLTIGFARRFATYKRAHLLFQNLDRLSKIVNSEKYPVQFVFAGKAHPADKAGQDLIKNIIEVSRRPEFVGKIVFIENYDMEIAKKLVQGVDIWMNTPTRPLEASGTSGEKAIMNGVLNLSVLDGWWAEGYKEGAGWALAQERTYQNQSYQDVLDSEIIYHLLENDITQLYYERNDNDTPDEWIQYVKNSFAMISPHFTMKRMLDDYQNKFYYKLEKRVEQLSEDNYKLALEYTEWKRKIEREWNNIEVKSLVIPDPSLTSFKVGEVFKMSVDLKINDLNPEDVAVDVIIGRKEVDFNGDYISILKMKHGEKVNNKVRYVVEDLVNTPGIVDIAIRVRPQHVLMPYMMDLQLVKWI